MDVNMWTYTWPCLLYQIGLSLFYANVCSAYVAPVPAPALSCPDGLPLDVAFVLPSTGSCYFFSNTPSPMPMSLAKSICEGVAGGHVVFLETEEEQTALDDELNDHWNFRSKKYWLGLEKLGGGWYWTIFGAGSRIAAGFERLDDIPDTHTDAIAMNSGFWWITATAGQSLYTICEVDVGHTLTFDIISDKDGHAGPGCPPGLSLANHFILPVTNSCYFGEQVEYGIDSARSICEVQSGGHIVFYETQAEMTAMDTKLKELWALHPDEWWLGMEKKAGVWKWTNSMTGLEKDVTWFNWFLTPKTEETLASNSPLLGWEGETVASKRTLVCEIDFVPNDPVPPTVFSTANPTSIATVFPTDVPTVPVPATVFSTDNPTSIATVFPTDVPTDPMEATVPETLKRRRFFRIGTGNYTVYNTSEVRSSTECACVCLGSDRCRGFSFIHEESTDCKLLTRYVFSDDFDCSVERCFLERFF